MSRKFDVSDMVPFGEKRRKLNEFIANVNEPDVDSILKANQSSTLIDLMKLSLADKFRRFDLMIELLSHGDLAMLDGVLSKRWLFENERSSLVDSQFLLNDCFPNVSYICRQKILHKIGRFVQSETKVDEIWSAVKQKYGFDVALPLFQGCSKTIITSTLANTKVNLSGYQLVQLLKKYPDVGLQYLKDNTVDCSRMNPQCSPLQYLYTHRPDDFLDLCINHPHKIQNFKIGRKRSSKMIRDYRDTLLDNPQETALLLRRDRIKRICTRDEFQKIFESTLPSDPCSVDAVWPWITTVPSEKRIEMVNEAYRNVYRIDLDQHPEYMTADYILLLPIERRLSVLQWKTDNLKCGSSWDTKSLSAYCYDPEKEKSMFIPLKPTSHSIPELKKLLLIEQNVENRATISKYLIQTCYINDDRSELLNVLNLLSQRSRNDQEEVRAEIFSNLAIVMSEMELSKEHWDIILEMVQTSEVFDDSSSYYHEVLIAKYIRFCVQSKLPVNDLVAKHLNMKVKRYYDKFDLNDIANLADRRTVLELYVKELPNLKLSTTVTEQIVVDFVEKIHRFNTAVEGSDIEPISLASHPWLISNFEQYAKEAEAQLEENCTKAYPSARTTRIIGRNRRIRITCHKGYNGYWSQPNRFMKIIKRLREKENLHLDAFNGSDYFFTKMWLWLPNHAIISRYLRRDPSYLVDNWTASLSRMLESKTCIALMKTLKKWNYSLFVNETIGKCTELINAPLDDSQDKKEQIQKKCNAAIVLSVLKGPAEWLEQVAGYYPPENKADVAADKSSEDYLMRATMAKSLINISEAHLAFEPIKKFCVGDYLKLTVDTLYSQMYRSLSSKSLHFLGEQLSRVPVSLHKHIIRLYFTISSLEEKYQGLQRIKSSNVTIRYVVFLETNKLFRLSPSTETWTMLSTIINSATADDASILEFIHSKPEVNTCPVEFISPYVQLLLHKCEPDKIEKLLKHVELAVEKIPGPTLDKIVTDYSGNQTNFNSALCVAYLHSSTSESIVEGRLSNIWSILKGIIENDWNTKLKCNYPARAKIFQFIRTLCVEIKHPAKVWLEGTIYRTLLQKFTSVSTTTFFLQFLSLELAILHIDTVQYSDSERLRQFGSRFAKFVDSLVDKYGRDIILVAMNEIIYFLNNFFAKEITKDNSLIVELVDAMLETSRSNSNQILAMKFTKHIEPKDYRLIEMLKKTNAVFSGSSDALVQIYSAVLNNL